VGNKAFVTGSCAFCKSNIPINRNRLGRDETIFSCQKKHILSKIKLSGEELATSPLLQYQLFADHFREVTKKMLFYSI
jgi:hypothetical protein